LIDSYGELINIEKETENYYPKISASEKRSRTSQKIGLKCTFTFSFQESVDIFYLSARISISSRGKEDEES